ncbi:MAG: hypothetical protein C0524_11105 [Rhodobacter sp.]|nr:hypothetical protein [Rhodobacter sp.]
MIRILAALTLIACPAAAETARVISGEHADFTRLVVEMPTADSWTVGRTAMGYAFATGADSQPAYDLSRVWQRIPRSRLQALRADPDTGVLQLTLACPCYVLPFEYRPGVIVLDIKDGPAPGGSAFEAPFSSTEIAGTEALPPAIAPAVYDWLAAARAPAAVDDSLSMPLPLHTGSVSLDPLRAKLLEQISRGAADGFVEMKLPDKPGKGKVAVASDLPWARISIGEVPGIGLADPDRARDMVAEGVACVPDATIALQDWGAGRPTLDLLVEARSGLYGEFDAVAPEAVLKAIRLHLYLGFGAEAAQYAALIEGEGQTGDLKIYLSMARLIDGMTDPETPFAGMLGCDGTAALWAALAYTRLPQGRAVNTDAILRSFLALPPHMRVTLGPGLAEKLLERGDTDAARMVRDALERTPDVPSDTVSLLDATADLRADRPDAARAHAEAAIAEGGETVDGLVALVEAYFLKAEPLSPEVVDSLRALQGPKGLGEATGPQQRALVLALALSGQTDDAFKQAAVFGPATPGLWRVAYLLASDDAFLRHAVLPEGGEVPDATPEVKLGVAKRLANLGFADAALAWLGPVSPADTAEWRRLAARAELARGDAGRAIALLDGLAEPQDEGLRAAALVQLGALALARKSYAAAGLTEEALRIVAWEKDWTNLQANGPPKWSAAAAAASAVTPVEAGPLARGSALLEGSTEARSAIDALLSSVPAPSF